MPLILVGFIVMVFVAPFMQWYSGEVIWGYVYFGAGLFTASIGLLAEMTK